MRARENFLPLPRAGCGDTRRLGRCPIGMRTYVRLMLLIAFAVVLPGGVVLLPLAYAQYLKISGRA